MQEVTTKEAFKRTSGSLHISPDGLRFESKDAPLAISDIESVEDGLHGSTTNPSVRVRYRSSGGIEEAYFSDARYFGYAGVFGGTQQLAEAIEHPGETTIETERPRAMRKLLIGLAVTAAVMLLFRLLV